MARVIEEMANDGKWKTFGFVNEISGYPSVVHYSEDFDDRRRDRRDDRNRRDGRDYDRESKDRRDGRSSDSDRRGDRNHRDRNRYNSK